MFNLTKEDSKQLWLSVHKDLHREVHNVAENSNVTVSNLLRPVIRKFIEGFPEKMKQPKPKDDF